MMLVDKACPAAFGKSSNISGPGEQNVKAVSIFSSWHKPGDHRHHNHLKKPWNNVPSCLIVPTSCEYLKTITGGGWGAMLNGSSWAGAKANNDDIPTCVTSSEVSWPYLYWWFSVPISEIESGVLHTNDLTSDEVDGLRSVFEQS